MRVLLTGANGFIGKYFYESYKEELNIQKFSFQNDDFNQLALNDVDTVVHLSALVHQMGGASYDEYNRINVLQTIELAKKAKQSDVKQFIYMSSVKVYGEETEVPYTETTICNPVDDYGRSKLDAEKQLKDLEDKNFIIAIVRTPIVYGKGVKANILNLVNLVDKMPVLPFGGIENKRSMVYIGNLCSMVYKLCIDKTSGIFLASDEQTVSTTALINMIAKTKGKNIVLLDIPFFPQLLKVIKPSYYNRLYKSLEIDNRWTKETLALGQMVTVEEGIESMLKR